jgi:hypothetical protein
MAVGGNSPNTTNNISTTSMTTSTLTYPVMKKSTAPVRMVKTNPISMVISPIYFRLVFLYENDITHKRRGDNPLLPDNEFNQFVKTLLVLIYVDTL